VIFYGLRFSYVLMTHATAPRSACTLAQARPTMLYILLVNELSIVDESLEKWSSTIFFIPGV